MGVGAWEVGIRPADVGAVAGEQMAALLGRARALYKDDRIVVELSLRDGRSRREVGGLLGVSAGTVSRRLRRILGRLNDPIVVALTGNASALRDDTREIALDILLRGLSPGGVARRRGMTAAGVAEQLGIAIGWGRSVAARGFLRGR